MPQVRIERGGIHSWRTGHPKGLRPLFFTEMWERLGFYLMVGILYLYIIDTERGGLGLSNATAGEIYGTYLAFVYFTPFLGGMIADRYLGFRKSVFIGGVLMARVFRPRCSQHADLLRGSGALVSGQRSFQTQYLRDGRQPLRAG